jgi:DnaK suppressor protein
MGKKQIEQIKKQLLERREKIEKELRRIADKETSVDEIDYTTRYPNIGDDIDDNAEEVTEYDQNLAIERTLEMSLRDIKSALQRIEKGTYGICKYCKKDIDVKRLKARPVSSSCMSCKLRIQKQ